MDDTPKARSAFSWPVIAAIGAAVVGVLLIKEAHDGSPSTAASSNWRISSGSDPMTYAKIVKAVGSPTGLEGARQAPAFIVECTDGTSRITIDYGQPMKDALPDGSLDLVHVMLKVDSAPPRQITFRPSPDWTVLSQVNATGGAVAQTTAQVLSGIFGDFLPEAKGIDTTWRAGDLIESLRGSRQLVTRATSASNISVTAVYDLAGFQEAFDLMPPSCH